MNVISENFSSLKLRSFSIAEIINAALRAADPQLATSTRLREIIVDLPFSSFQKIGLVSVGKAAIPMALGALDVLGDSISSGIVVSKVIPGDARESLTGMRILNGNHPVPGEESLQAGEAVYKFVERFDRQGLLLFLISGGASALVTRPVLPVTLDELMAVTSLLLASGASIDEMNAVRKHLDQIKGGGLAAAAFPAKCLSLVLSDVPGNRLDVIASGPTVPDLSTFSDALAVLEKYNLTECVPDTIIQHLQKGIAGMVGETPKQDDPIFIGSRIEIIGSHELALEEAQECATRQGYESDVLLPLISGEAKIQGERLAAFLREKSLKRQPDDKPRCWIAGGETIVTLTGDGIGGRNQELALATVKGLDGLQGVALITFATDGEDGRSPAAGAIVTGETFQKATEKGLNPDVNLANHDSYTFFKAINSVIETGSTGTNVNDLVVMLLD